MAGLEDADLCRKKCSILIDMIERERSEVNKFVKGNVEEEYCRLLDLEIQYLYEIRRKLSRL